MSRSKKRGLTLAAVAALAAVLVLGGYIYRTVRYQNTVRDFSFREPDMNRIADGAYIGACDVDFISARVEVTVADGAIQKVTILEHRHERGAAAEVVAQRIAAEQKIDVDEVSGATNSSRVIKKAAENALQ